MQFLISVLILSLISTCSTHIIEAGHRHENASSDFIRAEKCGHCARHGGSTNEPVLHQKTRMDSSKTQVLSNRDAGFQRNVPESGSTLILNKHDASKNINTSASLIRKNAQNILHLQPAQTCRHFRANSSELTSSQTNHSMTSYDHSSRLEFNRQSIEHKKDSEVEKTQEQDSKFSRWFSPKQISRSVKYALSYFLPESPVDTISKNLNLSKHGGNLSTFKSIYPIVLEGISVLANRLTDDDDDMEDISVPKNSIVASLMTTINQALTFDNNSEIKQSDSTKSTTVDRGNAFRGIQKVIESGLLKSTVSLVVQVLKNEDFQNITSELMNKSNTADVKIMFNKVSNVLQTTVFGLENALKHKDLILAMTKSINGTSAPVNLENIVSQYISKNDTSIGVHLSRNPLLQSAFVSKALSKSPVVHLGALDDGIKKLVTSSMEKAMSRIRIGEKGEIEMSDGMRKMLTKMVKEHEKSKKESGAASSDSIMDMIQFAVKSGNIKELTPVDTGPVKRRNVTHHSPLHRKFQLKYGKSSGYATVLQTGLHHTLLVLLSLTVVPVV